MGLRAYFQTLSKRKTKIQKTTILSFNLLKYPKGKLEKIFKRIIYLHVCFFLVTNKKNLFLRKIFYVFCFKHLKNLFSQRRLLRSISNVLSIPIDLLVFFFLFPLESPLSLLQHFVNTLKLKEEAEKEYYKEIQYYRSEKDRALLHNLFKVDSPSLMVL